MSFWEKCFFFQEIVKVAKDTPFYGVYLSVTMSYWCWRPKTAKSSGGKVCAVTTLWLWRFHARQQHRQTTCPALSHRCATTMDYGDGWCGMDCVRITANPTSGGEERRTPVRLRGRACADGLSFMKKSQNVKLLNEKGSFGMEFHEMITLARLVYFLNRPNARLHHGLDLGTIRLRFLVDTTPFEH